MSYFLEHSNLKFKKIATTQLFKVLYIASYSFSPFFWIHTNALSEKWINFYPNWKNIYFFRIVQLWGIVSHERFDESTQKFVSWNLWCFVIIAGRKTRFNLTPDFFIVSQSSKFARKKFPKNRQFYFPSQIFQFRKSVST